MINSVHVVISQLLQNIVQLLSHRLILLVYVAEVVQLRSMVFLDRVEVVVTVVDE